MLPELLQNERLDELIRGKALIIQKKHGFRFGTDAVLLADFALIRSRAKVMDFGAGTGVIALLVALKNPGIQVSAVELQPEMAEMAQRSIQLNGLADRINLLCGDIRDAARLFGYGLYDQVICNPPYNELNRSLPPNTESRLISRMEVGISIEEICQSAFSILKSGGRLSVVFPSQRLHEMLFAMDRAHLAPKRIRCVEPYPGRAPRIMLLDAVKHGGSQLEWLPPLILQNEDGSYTEEWFRIYGE